jgi:hypothetical protein
MTSVRLGMISQLEYCAQVALSFVAGMQGRTDLVWCGLLSSCDKAMETWGL